MKKVQHVTPPNASSASVTAANAAASAVAQQVGHNLYSKQITSNDP
jgi:hypothetical protein